MLSAKTFGNSQPEYLTLGQEQGVCSWKNNNNNIWKNIQMTVDLYSGNWILITILLLGGSVNLGEFLDFSWLIHQTRRTRYSFKILATLNSVWDSQSGQKVSSKTEDQSWGGSDGKEFAYNAGDLGLILGLGRSPVEKNGNSRQYSCLENCMDRGAWQATVHGVITIEQLTHPEEENELPREPGKEFEPNAEKRKNKIKISFQKCISTSKKTSVLKLYLQLLSSHT